MTSLVSWIWDIGPPLPTANRFLPPTPLYPFERATPRQSTLYSLPYLLITSCLSLAPPNQVHHCTYIHTHIHARTRTRTWQWPTLLCLDYPTTNSRGSINLLTTRPQVTATATATVTVTKDQTPITCPDNSSSNSNSINNKISTSKLYNNNHNNGYRPPSQAPPRTTSRL